ncbi:mobilisation protein (MobC) [Arachidicoccus rhizosphaerae]|uniref:Mobilisation protein (MobC) n=1 Tax=Arachidicoccus rhizosphaerae TaxID=551991 RepID=A0A1H4B068_9BACT|nr:plasmid mobilization relaxosome protein MobC [Arachidicoccus rhizosphaerae]SEA41454.1 mobilisation protein (MobC) [Arachidicoccus rhizosphaerae]
MEQKIKGKKGRPKVAVPRNRWVKSRVNSSELILIKQKARDCNLSVSDLIKVSLFKCKVVVWRRELPTEAKKLLALLANLANNLNQISKRHNIGDAITLADRFELLQLKMELSAVKKQLGAFLEFKKEAADGD